MSTTEPATHPHGGSSIKSGGSGVFKDAVSGEPINIWLDIGLQERRHLLKLIKDEEGEIASVHADPDVHLLILSPQSTHIFDTYCHPAWLKATTRSKLQCQREADGLEGEEAWMSKVLLKKGWLGACVREGRFLGEDEAWGGFRAGGPPTIVDPLILTPAPPVPLFDAVPRPRPVTPEPTVWSGLKDLRSPSEPEEPIEEAVDVEMNGPAAANMLQDDVSIAEPSFDVEMAEPRRPPPSPASFGGASIRKGRRRDPSPAADADMQSDSDGSNSGGSDDTDGTAGLLREASQNIRRTPPSLAKVRGEVEVGPSRTNRSASGKMFDGLAFYVDTKKADRAAFLQQIKSAGGVIVTEVADATHVLVDKYVTSKSKWDPIIRSNAQAGVWFLSFVWLSESFEKRQMLPEAEYHIPGGAPASERQKFQPSGPRPPLRIATQKPPAGPHITTEELEQIFSQHSGHGAQGNTVQQLVRLLAEKYGKYKENRWRELYKAWKSSSGRFHPIHREAEKKVLSKHNRLVLEAMPEPKPLRIAPGPVAPISQITTAPPLPAPVPAALPSLVSTWGPPSTAQVVPTPISTAAARHSVMISTQQLERIFSGQSGRTANIAGLVQGFEQKYGQYSHQTWNSMFRDYRMKRGRFAYLAGQPSLGPSTYSSQSSDPSATQLVRLSASQATKSPARQTESARISNKQLEEIFKEFMPAVEAGMGNAELGDRLVLQYTKGTWLNYFNEWRNKIHRFKYLMRENMEQEGGDHDAAWDELLPASQATMTWDDLLPTPSPGSRSSRVGIGKMTTSEQAEVFKQYEHLLDEGMTFANIGDKIAAEYPGLSSGTWKVYFGEWSRGAGQFAILQDNVSSRAGLPFTRGRGSASVLPQNTRESLSKRSSISSSQQSSQKRPRAAAYSEEEEMAMAAYIFGRLPTMTSKSARDWEEFHRTQSSRSTAAYVEHYRLFQARIDEFVRKMGGRIRSGSAVPRERASAGSSDGSVVFLGSDKGDKEYEVIEVRDSD